MKYFKRLKVYKASNVIFYPEKLEAYSYDWWKFLEKINNKLVFNNYKYSATTIKHQYKIKEVLRDLNIKIDLEVSCPVGLQSPTRLISIDKYYSEKIRELKEKINNPRSQQKKNKERLNLIDFYAKQCIDFKLLEEAV